VKSTLTRVYPPPDANCLLSVADQCFRSENRVNLIVINWQLQLHHLDAGAITRCPLANRVMPRCAGPAHL
jgi:xylulose-5-phosphate/fructose-6-phosphate phosphoketolase